jgi:hypothetical protein
MLTAPRRSRSRVLPEVRLERWLGGWTGPRALGFAAWLTPLFVFVAVHRLPETYLKLAIGGPIALAVVLIGSRRPTVVLWFLVIFLPTKDFALALAYRFGVPGELVRPVTSLKELALLTLAVAAVRQHRQRQEPLDRLDRLAIALVVLGLVYYAFPFFGAGSTSTNARLVALRVWGAGPLAFLVARHIGMSERAKERLAGVIVATGSLVALTLIVEKLDPGWWQHFVLFTVRVHIYFAQVQHAPIDTNVLFNPDRPGGIFLFAVPASAYLIVSVIVAGHRISRQPSPWWLAGCAMSFAGIAIASSRGPFGVVIVGIALAGRRTVSASPRARARFLMALAAAALLAAPFVMRLSVVQRTLNGNATDTASNQDHVSQLELSVRLLSHFPLGLGLGTGQTSQRFGTGTFSHTSESGYLQIADEMGVLALVLWSLLILGMIRTARDRARHQVGAIPRAGPALSTIAASGFALMLAYGVLSLITDPWADVATTWTVFAVMGIALSGVDAQRSHHAAPRHDLQPA